VNSASMLADRGAKVSTSALMERLNLPQATDEADALGIVGGTELLGIKTQGTRQEVANSEVPDAMQDLRTALAADLQPLGDALFAAYQSKDGAAMTAALRKISKDMPALAGDAIALSDVLSRQFTTDFITP